MLRVPALYKFLDVHGARLTLGNRNFRFAKPSEYEDTEELTIRSIFPEDEEAACETFKNNIHEVILKNLDKTVSALNERMRLQILLIQHAFKNNPKAADIIRNEMSATPLADVYDIARLREKNIGFVHEINAHMQRFRILCVTSKIESEEIWKRYAQGNEGIALRIIPDVSKDSIYQLFRQVEYKESRPPLFENAISYLENSMFGNKENTLMEIMGKIIRTKTKKWEYETEYRLAIPIFDGDNWNTLSFHPHEISEIYFGYKIDNDMKTELLNLATTINPNIRIFDAFIDRDKKIAFR